MYVPSATPRLKRCCSGRHAPYDQYLPYDPEHQGVPVTCYTAAPGMLVRRGYDGLVGGDSSSVLAGEVSWCVWLRAACDRQRNKPHWPGVARALPVYAQ